MATQQQAGSSRAVVLLKPQERQKLERLAATEKASSGEILRRSLRAYEPGASPEDDELMKAMLADMNVALDKALLSIQTSRASIREALEKIDTMRATAR
jgi:hypothetical protein